MELTPKQEEARSMKSSKTVGSGESSRSKYTTKGSNINRAASKDHDADYQNSSINNNDPGLPNLLPVLDHNEFENMMEEPPLPALFDFSNLLFSISEFESHFTFKKF